MYSMDLPIVRAQSNFTRVNVRVLPCIPSGGFTPYTFYTYPWPFTLTLNFNQGKVLLWSRVVSNKPYSARIQYPIIMSVLEMHLTIWILNMYRTVSTYVGKFRRPWAYVISDGLIKRVSDHLKVSMYQTSLWSYIYRVRWPA